MSKLSDRPRPFVGGRTAIGAVRCSRHKELSARLIDVGNVEISIDMNGVGGEIKAWGLIAVEGLMVQ